MSKKQKIACIIPARLASTRLASKMLKLINNKPLVQWTYETAASNSVFDHVVLAIDDEQVRRAVETFGGNYIMTSPSHPTGTDRIVEVMQSNKYQADIWLNWQGDTPFVNNKMISDFATFCKETPSDIWTLQTPLTDAAQINSPAIVKVVCALNKKALYFSRSAIPYYRNTEIKDKQYYKHLGIYAYTQESLAKIASLPPTPLETREYLEQLRWLENGLSIAVLETQFDADGIDTQADLDKAQIIARASQDQAVAL
jgi:3-deoxy-D-manno-octulosonate cytidylyltransferase